MGVGLSGDSSLLGLGFLRLTGGLGLLLDELLAFDVEFVGDFLALGGRGVHLQEFVFDEHAKRTAVTTVGGGLGVSGFTGKADCLDDFELIFVQFHFSERTCVRRPESK